MFFNPQQSISYLHIVNKCEFANYFFREILSCGNDRPISPLDNERYGVYSLLLERVAIPCVFVSLANCHSARFDFSNIEFFQILRYFLPWHFLYLFLHYFQVVLLLTNLLRYFLLRDTVGHWTDMFIVRQVCSLFKVPESLFVP